MPFSTEEELITDCGAQAETLLKLGKREIEKLLYRRGICHLFIGTAGVEVRFNISDLQKLEMGTLALEFCQFLSKIKHSKQT